MNYHVYVRVRPSLNVADTCAIYQSPYRRNAIILSDGNEERQYEANQLISESDSNEEVAHVMLPRLLEAVRKGETAICLAYGETGSGKTHTILGTREQPGIIFNAFQRLLSDSVSISLSVIEIYNECIYDLLNEKRELKPKNDQNNELILPNLLQHECESISLFREIIHAAMDVRITRKTTENETSSRSHLLLILRYEINADFEGQLIFGDLAGSENFTDNKSVAGKEGISINKSLLSLNNAIINMSRGREPSFRESNLTRLLEHGFEEGVVSLLTNVTKFDYRETRRTLYLAEETRLIKTEPALKTEVDKIHTKCDHLILDKHMIYRCVRSVLRECIDFDDTQLRALLYTGDCSPRNDANEEDIDIEVPLSRLEHIERFSKLSDAVLYAICEILPRIRSTEYQFAIYPHIPTENSTDSLTPMLESSENSEELVQIRRKNEENDKLLEEIIQRSE